MEESGVFCDCGSGHTLARLEDTSVVQSEGHFPEKAGVVFPQQCYVCHPVHRGHVVLDD